MTAVTPALRGAVEAIVLVVEEPVKTADLAQAIGIAPAEVQVILQQLQREYERDARGFELQEVAGGWRICSRRAYADVVERFVIGGQQTRLSQAALETLAVVAYRQPISRARVGAVRGVNVDGVIRTLSARGLIEETGTDRDSGALLYRTTPMFLERLGLNSLNELPPLAPYLPEIAMLDNFSEDLLA